MNISEENDFAVDTVSGGQVEKNKVEGGVLYIVSTPIGNLADISRRALKILCEVDFVAAEDTRNSGRLLAAYGISKPMLSYFEHNKKKNGELILQRLIEGQSCALITDAGTPAISDPGQDIVMLCAERGVKVCTVPGCCAAVAALSVSGLPTGRFVFEGFLSAVSGERKKRLGELSAETRTVIIYEAPHKLRRTLEDMYSAFGDRKISLCRELTKLNEEVIRTKLSDAINYYSEKEPRGEYVIVVSGASSDECEKKAFWADMSVIDHVGYYEYAGMKKTDAVKAVAKDRGVPKSVIYNEVIKDRG